MDLLKNEFLKCTVWISFIMDKKDFTYSVFLSLKPGELYEPTRESEQSLVAAP